MILFAQDGGFWHEAGKQGTVAFVVIALGSIFIAGFFGFLYKFCQWSATQYVTPAFLKHIKLVDTCNENLGLLVSHTQAQTKAIVGDDENSGIAKDIKKIKESNEATLAHILEWPSDIPAKLEEARCRVAECEAAGISREQFQKLLEISKKHAQEKKDKDNRDG